MDFGGWAVRVSRHDALAEGFQAAHLGLDPAAGVVSGPPFPKRPAEMSGGTQRLVSRHRCRAVLLPQPPVFADWNDRGGLPVNDGGVAAARVVGAVGSDGANLLARRDLVQQVGQHGAVAVAAWGEFHGANVGCGRVHGQMDLAPLASALHPMLARLPFAITQELDTSAVHEQVERPVGTAIGDLHGQGLLPAAQGGEVRYRPVRPRQFQQACHHACGLAQRQLEQDLDRQAELYGRIGKHRWPSRSPVMRRAPGHVLVDPDQ